jgi:hypothetical protein
MTQHDIENEITDRVTILNWMVKFDYSSINQVGSMMRSFYANPQQVKDAAYAGKDPRELFGE